VEGWPDVEVGPSDSQVPVLARKPLQPLAVSPRQKAAWPIGEKKEDEVHEVFLGANGRDLTILSGSLYAPPTRLTRWEYDGATKPADKEKMQPALDVSLDKLPELTGSGESGSRSQLPGKLSPDGRWYVLTTGLSWAEFDNAVQKDPPARPLYRIMLLDCKTGKLAQKMEVEGAMPIQAVFSSDSRTLVTVQRSLVARGSGPKDPPKWKNDIRLWDTSNGRLRTTLPCEEGESVGGTIAILSDGQTLAADLHFWDPSKKSGELRMRLWDLSKGTSRSFPPLPDSKRLFDVHFVGDGHTVLAYHDDNGKKQFVVHDLDKEQANVAFECDASSVTCFVAGDGRSAFCCTNTGRIVKLELPSGKILAEQQATTNFLQAYTCWALSPDGKYLAAGMHTNPPYRHVSGTPEEWEEVQGAELQLWDTAKLTPLEPLTGHRGPFKNLAFSTDGQWLVSVGDCTVTPNPMLRLWDVKNLEEARNLPNFKVVNYEGLEKAIKAQHGKVVVVDYWADTCIICKREFPRLVEMQKQYGDKDFAAISVALDDPNHPGAKDKVLQFLRAKNARFSNFILDETAEFWQKTLGFDGPPGIFVYGRDGTLKKKFINADAKYDDIEKLVKELMDKK